jgi:competence protein ComEC
MRALIEWLAAGFVTGQLLGGAGGQPVGRIAGAAGAALACGALAAARARWRRGAGAGAAFAAAALAGALLVAWTQGVPDDPDHVAHLALPVRARVVGRIAGRPVADGRRTILALDVVEVGGAARPQRAWGRVRVRVRGPVALARGDVVAFVGTLRRPHNFANPGGFDVVASLARRGIHVVASVWDPTTIERLGREPTPLPARALDAWRADVGRALEHAGTPDVTAVLTALVLGDEAGIADDVRRAFTRAGVVHVLSVSGLHVGMVAATTAAAIAWMVGWSEWLLLRVDRRKLAGVAGLGVALLYGGLTGSAVATLRSLVMAAVVVAAVLLDRDADARRVLALAAVGTALLAPGAPCEISYQLSFVSVAALLAGAAHQTSDDAGPRWWRRSRRAGRAAAAAWIGTAPLTAFHFHQVSLVSVLANPLVIPLFEGLAVLPGLAGAVVAPIAPAAAHAAMVLAAVPVGVALVLVRVIGGWRWSAVDVPFPDLAELVLLYGLIAGVWLRSSRIGRAAMVASLVLLAIDAGRWAVERTARNELRVTFLDVGQGDASVVELPGGRVLVVDAGGFAGSDFDTGAAIVEPFLRARKIQSVDAVVMSHAHPDHAGGLAALVRAMAPGELWWSGMGGEGAAWAETVRALRETDTPVRLLQADTAIADFPEIDVLHPPRGWTVPSLNDGSLVIRVRHGATALLLTGDAEQAAETAMHDRASRLGAAVLKVPHHGSRTSSGWSFLDAVDPRIAIASLGADNRFGHPAPEVEARYAARGVAFYRTDRCGAVTLVVGRDGLRVETARPACREPNALTTRPPP